MSWPRDCGESMLTSAKEPIDVTLCMRTVPSACSFFQLIGGPHDRDQIAFENGIEKVIPTVPLGAEFVFRISRYVDLAPELPLDSPQHGEELVTSTVSEALTSSGILDKRQEGCRTGDRVPTNPPLPYPPSAFSTSFKSSMRLGIQAAPSERADLTISSADDLHSAARHLFHSCRTAWSSASLASFRKACAAPAAEPYSSRKS